MNPKAKKVAILGSWHNCLFTSSERFPCPGETLIGDSYFTTGGGKGANQACGCGMYGGNCYLVQKLGLDEEGRQAVETFKKYGVQVDYVKLDENESTGLALVMTARNGENSIIIIPGAHGHYTEADIDAAKSAFEDAFMAGFVLETNLDATEYAIKKAHAMGVQVFLDPAPAAKFDPSIYKCLTWLKPNEHEASVLSGIDVVDFDSAVKAAHWFMGQGVKNVLITLGGCGSVLVTPEVTRHFPTPKVKVVDTTTAGDIFAGSFVYALSVDMPVEEAVIFATCAGALTVTRPGSVESAGSYDEVMALVEEYKQTL